MNQPIAARTYTSLRDEIHRIARMMFMLSDSVTITDQTHMGTGVGVRLQRAVSEVAGEPITDIGLDSIDAVEMVMAVEDHFGIVITEDEEKATQTFGQLVDLVAAKAGIQKESTDHAS